MTDPSRTLSTASGPVPRSFVTIVRYPEVSGARTRPLPLIVFGYGFAVSPAPYQRLLDAWTRAGYVVAAPVFPLENAAHPGGPDEHDPPNQPADMSLVISTLTDGPLPRALAGRVDARAITVAGQSDGGDTALAAAYDPTVRDPPGVDAAIILSGTEDPFAAAFRMPADGPPLLAVPGTADTINPPADTDAFYAQAQAPKFLLRLLGAGHPPPYTEPGPQLTTVERTTIAFLDWRFQGQTGPFHHLLNAGGPGPDAVLSGQS
jgi:dienelactone hydrolase